MADDLLRYYESELTFIRQMAGQFAQKHKRVAARLQLRDETKEAQDPHVERLMEAFALLTARVRAKIDDEFPEIVESLLQVLYPHYLRPIPPMAIAQFRCDPEQRSPGVGTLIPKGSALRSRTLQGNAASFRTAYPVNLWPIEIRNVVLSTVSSANFPNPPSEASHVLRIQLGMLDGLPANALQAASLRFYLAGDGSPRHTLYELLMEHARWAELRSANRSETILRLPSECIQPVGFSLDEGVLPALLRSFPGYRLLQEYFQFPEKFLFFDVTGLDTVDLSRLSSTFDLAVFFRDSELREMIPAAAQATRGEAIQLGCTPVINLFDKLAEPIRVSHTVTEYQVIPDRHRLSTTEVYSVDRVTSSAASADEQSAYEPFYSIRHTYGELQANQCFWHENRRSSLRPGDDGTEVCLALVDRQFDPSAPASDVLSVLTTCTNRDFVARLAWQREWGDLISDEFALVEARCTVPPTPSRRPPLEGGLQWRLISHLSLNHLSLINGGNAEALRELLGLYCLDGQEGGREQIQGIAGVDAKPAVSRVVFDSGVAFCRGLDIEIEFDEDRFSGSGAYLMASVLERFVALYGTINSFTRLTARSRQRRQPISRWAPRVGERRLA